MSLKTRTRLPHVIRMKPDELLRRLKKAAKRRGVAFAFDASLGKGSHGRVYFGSRATTLPTHGDLPRGTLHGVLKELGLNERDL